MTKRELIWVLLFEKICSFLCSHSSNTQLKAEIESLKRDVDYYSARAESLAFALTNAVEIPDIAPFVEGRKVIRPCERIKEFGDFDLVVADSSYYAFPEEAWLQILTPVQEQVKKVLGTWEEEIKDCDDWALLMAAFVAAAFAKTDIDLQGAFCIMWGGGHAYNSFITLGGDWKIYEPQGNTIQGILGETTGIYKSNYIWFMG